MNLPDYKLDPSLEFRAENISPECYDEACGRCDWDNPGACACPCHEEIAVIEPIDILPVEVNLELFINAIKKGQSDAV